jgi:hypothetical protein
VLSLAHRVSARRKVLRWSYLAPCAGRTIGDGVRITRNVTNPPLAPLRRNSALPREKLPSESFTENQISSHGGIR